jgi:hypothetical protein
MTLRAARAIRTGIADRNGMTAAIESTLAVHTIGSLWLVGCMLYLHWSKSVILPPGVNVRSIGLWQPFSC